MNLISPARWPRFFHTQVTKLTQFTTVKQPYKKQRPPLMTV